MTRAQLADELLCAAKHWQNCESRPEGCCKAADQLFYFANDTAPYHSLTAMWLHEAGMALSEVCALGYDIDGAEKVTSFTECGGVRREDQSEYKLYRAVKR
jgi:hypothetical protein